MPLPLYNNGWEVAVSSDEGMQRPVMYEYREGAAWAGGVFGGDYKRGTFDLFKQNDLWENDSCIHYHNNLAVPVKITSVLIGLCSCDSAGQQYREWNGTVYDNNDPIEGHRLPIRMKVRVTADGGTTWKQTHMYASLTPPIGSAALEYAQQHHGPVRADAGSTWVADITDLGYAGKIFANDRDLADPIRVTYTESGQDCTVWSTDDPGNLNSAGVGSTVAHFGRYPYGTAPYSKWTGFTYSANRLGFNIWDCPIIQPNEDAFVHFGVDISQLPDDPDDPSQKVKFGVAFNMDPNTQDEGVTGQATVEITPVTENQVWKLQVVNGQRRWVAVTANVHEQSSSGWVTK